MSIDKTTFPPRRDNPFRLVGGVDVTAELEQRRANPIRQDDEPAPRGRWREQHSVAHDIEEYERAARDIGKQSPGSKRPKPVKSPARMSTLPARISRCCMRKCRTVPEICWS